MNIRYARNIPALSEEECQLLKTKRILIAGCGGLGGHLLELFARPIAAIFNGTDTALIDMAGRVIRYVNLLLPIVPLQMMATTFFQAINQPLKAAFLSLSRQILLVIPLVLILPLFMGLEGVFLAPVVADGISTVLAVALLKHFFNAHGQTVFFKKK